MKIYYYHTRPIREALQEWKEKKHPGHILYGLTHFEKHGIDTVLHPYRHFNSRLRLSFYTVRKILFCKEKFDIVYGTSFLGLELLIFLRALGLYRKPIVVWHHSVVTSSSNAIWEKVSTLFYKGIDKFFFFSQVLIDASVATGKVKTEDCKLIHWGPDLDFYDHIRQTVREEDRFISTGKEHRDFDTLLKAFTGSEQKLVVYTMKNFAERDYEDIFTRFLSDNPSPTIRVEYVSGIIPLFLAQEVAASKNVVICCQEYQYTVGLTTLVEAFALGKPVIISANPWFEQDIEKEDVGITVPYGDVEGWKKAIKYLSLNKEAAARMGKNAYLLAQKQYNLELYTGELADVLYSLYENSDHK